MDFIIFPLVYLINGLIFGFVTAYLSRNKGYDGGFAWGFFLGLIGLIVVICRVDHSQNVPVQAATPLIANEYRPKTANAKWTCLVCGAQNPNSLDYCLSCRSNRKEDIKWKCSCGVMNKMTNTHCWVCGLKKGETPVQNAADEAEQGWICPNCRTQNTQDALYCKHCGLKETAQTSGWSCAACGRQNEQDAAYCISCGNRR